MSNEIEDIVWDFLEINELNPIPIMNPGLSRFKCDEVWIEVKNSDPAIFSITDINSIHRLYLDKQTVYIVAFTQYRKRLVYSWYRYDGYFVKVDELDIFKHRMKDVCPIIPPTEQETGVVYDETVRKHGLPKLPKL